MEKACIRDGCGILFNPNAPEKRDARLLRPFWKRYCPKHRMLENPAVIVEEIPVKEKTVFLVVQEGGSSTELYLHSFDTSQDAQNYKTECDENGGYRTSPVLEIPEGMEKYLSNIEEVLRSLSNLE